MGELFLRIRFKTPKRYGVVTFDASGKATALEEKPKNPTSTYAVPGIYFYDNEVVSIAKQIKPSPRGELEITDVNKMYLERGKLQVQVLDSGTAWLDTGTFTSLMQAAQFVQVLQERQGIRIGAIEDIALRMGFINQEQYQKITSSKLNNSRINS
jgi:glucose-1-phosphate thymidylyltransferase